MNGRIKIRVYKYNNFNIFDKKNYQKSLININNNTDNDDCKLKNNDDINEFEEKYYFDSNRITLKEKICFIFYILIGTIILLHSFHFVLSEYVRKNILIVIIFFSSLYVFIYSLLLGYLNFFFL